MAESCILLVSGGIDSFIAWNFLGRPATLFVDYGQKYINIERAAIDKLYNNCHHIKLDGAAQLPDQVFVPARNLMLATLALRYSTNIALGGVRDEICRDKSPSAFRIMSKVLSKFNATDVIVTSPIWHMTKSQAVKYYVDNFPNDVGFLSNTVSCYSDHICNDCDSCFRRFVAMASNGIIEQDRLPNDNIVRKFVKNINTHPYSRVIEAILVLVRLKYNITISFKNNDANISYQDISGTIKHQQTVQALRTQHES